MRKRGTWWIVRQALGGPRLVIFMLAAGLCLLLAACASGSTGGQASATQTTTGSATIGLPTATDQAALTPPPIPSYPAGGTPGTLGTGDYCDPNEQEVTASLPSNIPTYPGAQMHLGSVNGPSGVFGLCTNDSLQTVAQFYTAQLPSHNWQQVTTATNTSAFVQITASSGSTNLTVTIAPSDAVKGKTQIIIIYAGQ